MLANPSVASRPVCRPQIRYSTHVCSRMATSRKTLPGRLELPTLRLTASRSNQLSYGSTELAAPKANSNTKKTRRKRNHRNPNRKRKQPRRKTNQRASPYGLFSCLLFSCGDTLDGPVAQWIRHRPTEPGIAGSSPAGVTYFSVSNNRPIILYI